MYTFSDSGRRCAEGRETNPTLKQLWVQSPENILVWKFALQAGQRWYYDTTTTTVTTNKALQILDKVYTGQNLWVYEPSWSFKLRRWYTGWNISFWVPIKGWLTMKTNVGCSPNSKLIFSGSYCDLQRWRLKRCASVLWTGEHVSDQRGGLHTTPRPRDARSFTTADAVETRITSDPGDSVLESALEAERVWLF